MNRRFAWIIVALAMATCGHKSEPPPWVDPGSNEHHSDRVGDVIDDGSPTRYGGESAGGYTGGGSIGSGSSASGGIMPAPATFEGTSGTSTVPLVRNDIVKGRELALAAALRDAVVREAGKNGMTSIPPDVLAKSRRYITRYKIIKEGATDEGNYAMELQADVDVQALRGDVSSYVGGAPAGQTIELFVDNVRRARDLRAIAATLRDDRRVRAVRQQSFARNRAVLEVDTVMVPAEVAEIVQTTACEDGVSVTVSAVNERSVRTAIVFPTP